MQMTSQNLTSDDVVQPWEIAFARKLGFQGSAEDWAELLSPSRSPKLLNDDTDLSALRPRTFRVDEAHVAAALGLPSKVPGFLSKFPSTSSSRIYCFQPRSEAGIPVALWMTLTETDRAPSGPWWLAEIALGREASPSEQILELARIDGWTAVYDPSNEQTVAIDGSDEIQTLADGLNHLPPLTLGSPGDTMALSRGEFGLLHGMAAGNGTLSSSFSEAQRLPQPNTIITLARSKSSEPGDRFLFDGVRKSRQTVHTRNESGTPLSIWSGSETPGGNPTDTEPHLITATFNGSRSRLSIDSRLYRADSDAKNHRALGGLTLGGDHQGKRRWQGTIGPVLIRQGDMPADAQTRMESVIYRHSGLLPQEPLFPDDVIVYSVDATGRPTLAHGVVNTVVGESGIASITKLMTAWLTRQAFDNDIDLAAQAEILAQDRHRYSYRRFRTGDLISHGDLLRAMLMASDNTAPYTLARVLGSLLPGGGNPVGMFVDEMNAEASRLGYEGAKFTAPWNFGRMSAAQIADLYLRMLQDEILVDMMGTLFYEVSIGGPQRRIQPIQHRLLNSSEAPASEMHAAKTGTWPLSGLRHIAYAWKHADGSTHVTVVLNAPTQRIRDAALRFTMLYVENSNS